MEGFLFSNRPPFLDSLWFLTLPCIVIKIHPTLTRCLIPYTFILHDRSPSLKDIMSWFDPSKPFVPARSQSLWDCSPHFTTTLPKGLFYFPSSFSVIDPFFSKKMRKGQSWFVKSWPYQQFRWNQWYWMEFYFYWFNPTHHQEIFFTLLGLAFWKRCSSKIFPTVQGSSLQNTSRKQKSIKIPCPSWRHLAFEHLLLDPWFDQQAQKFPRGSHGGKGHASVGV